MGGLEFVSGGSGSSGSGAGLPSNIVNASADRTAVAGDCILMDASGGAHTVTLPAAPAVGALVEVKKVDGTTNTVTVAPSGGGTIDGQATATTVTPYAGSIFQHTGSNVWIIPDPVTGPAGTNGTNGTNAILSTIEDEGSALTQRSNMNFTGAGVTATDAGGKTVVTIPGVAAGSVGLIPRKLISGRYVTTPGSVSNVAVSPGYVMVFPFEVFESTSFVEMALNVVTGQASCVGRVGIYSDSGGLPGTLLFEATTTTQLDFSSSGQKTAAITQTLAAGIYWIALLAQGGAGNPTLSGTQFAPVMISSTTIAGAVQNSISGYADNGGHTSGAMPSTLTAPIGQQTVVPRIALKTA